MLSLSVHFHPQTTFFFPPVFVYDFGLLVAPLVSKFHAWQLIKKENKMKQNKKLVI